MSYGIRTRLGDRYLSTWSANHPTSGPQSARYHMFREYETVYSFRTGKGERNQRFLSEQRHNETNIFDAITARYELYESLLRQTQAPERRGAPDKFVSSDLGHEFATYKWKRTLGPNIVNQGPSSPYTNVKWTGVIPAAMHWPNYDGTSSFQAAGLPDIPGIFRVSGNSRQFPYADSPLTRARLTNFGTGQIAGLNPLKRKATILTTLLELARGDIPRAFSSLAKHQKDIMFLRTKYHDFESFNRALKSAKLAGKDAGDDYLNVIFGWSPIIRDLENAFDILTGISKLLYVSNTSRRRIRRVVTTWNTNSRQTVEWSLRGSLIGMGDGSNLTERTEIFGTLGFNSLNLPTDYGVSGKLSVQTTARFTLGQKPSATLNGYLDRAADLFGLKLTPEVIWELTPWTWMLDWFSNIGNVVSNLNSRLVSNVILNYGYTTGVLDFTSVASAVPTAGMTGSPLLVVSDHHLVKSRIQSNPFGLFVDPASLTASQWSILAALGLSRSR